MLALEGTSILAAVDALAPTWRHLRANMAFLIPMLLGPSTDTGILYERVTKRNDSGRAGS